MIHLFFLELYRFSFNIVYMEVFSVIDKSKLLTKACYRRKGLNRCKTNKDALGFVDLVMVFNESIEVGTQQIKN